MGEATLQLQEPTLFKETSKIRFKNGAEVRVLDAARQRVPETLAFARDMKQDVDDVVSELSGDMSGYVVLAWDHGGTGSGGLRNGTTSLVATRMLPTSAAQCIRSLRKEKN